MAVARGSAVQEVYAVLYDDVMPSCMQYALVIVINIPGCSIKEGLHLYTGSHAFSCASYM